MEFFILEVLKLNALLGFVLPQAKQMCTIHLRVSVIQLPWNCSFEAGQDKASAPAASLSVRQRRQHAEQHVPGIPSAPPQSTWARRWLLDFILMVLPPALPEHYSHCPTPNLSQTAGQSPSLSLVTRDVWTHGSHAQLITRLLAPGRRFAAGWCLYN